MVHYVGDSVDFVIPSKSVNRIKLALDLLGCVVIFNICTTFRSVKTLEPAMSGLKVVQICTLTHSMLGFQ